MAYIQLLLLFIIGVVYSNFISYYKRFLQLDYKRQDYKSVTVSNYTIELQVTDKMWENFLAKHCGDEREGEGFEESTNKNKLFIEELRL